MKWNRCDICGRFIPLADFETGKELPEITKQLFAIGNFLDSIQLALNDEYFRGK